MKFLLSIWAVILCQISIAQSKNPIETKLLKAFERIQYWCMWQDDENSNFDKQDSIDAANLAFDRLLCAYASKDNSLFEMSLPSLIDKGLEIIGSSDGLIQVYTWDESFGTRPMSILRNVIQYKSGNKCYAISAFKETEVPNLKYLNIYTFKKGTSTFYVVESSYQQDKMRTNYVSIYAIQGATLNKKVKLIKTQSGLTHQLKYNFEPDVLNEMQYEMSFATFDDVTKTISIPVIKGTSNVTDQSINYRFNGSYFEKK